MTHGALITPPHHLPAVIAYARTHDIQALPFFPLPFHFQAPHLSCRCAWVGGEGMDIQHLGGQVPPHCTHHATVLNRTLFGWLAMPSFFFFFFFDTVCVHCKTGFSCLPASFHNIMEPTSTAHLCLPAAPLPRHRYPADNILFAPAVTTSTANTGRSGSRRLNTAVDERQPRHTYLLTTIAALIPL